LQSNKGKCCQQAGKSPEIIEKAPKMYLSRKASIKNETGCESLSRFDFVPHAEVGAVFL
jgi:hypothetical protein